MESKYPTIKRHQFGENLIPHENPKTPQCCQIWKNQYEEKFDQLVESVKQLKSSIEELTATTVQQNCDRSHDNWIFAPERPESYSAKDRQPSDNCINRKFFPQERTIGHSRTVTTTTTKL
ncbi:uncharacterized protein LOC119601488 [Lucilia sericata]|uniref:uncharacterized protein LOC119601488 n=1 Tax=Lucilia sericata TaxID=13632 RepID=UPI0018A825C1|nr:uncharacterized protein LOC119601488 [Lucilia sericata]